MLKFDEKILDKDLDYWRQVFEEPQNDKDFCVFINKKHKKHRKKNSFINLK